VSAPVKVRTDKRGGVADCISLLVEQALRGKCIELAVFLHRGLLPPLLLEEVIELTEDSWALREGDHT